MVGEERPNAVVLVFGDRRLPNALRGLPLADPGETDAARRLIVVGSDADLATVLTRLLRAEKLDVEIGFVPNRGTARRARHGTPRRVPLIRDETGQVVVGCAEWLPADATGLVHGEAVVDDTVLFDGDVAGVRIEPTAAMPGLRARVANRGRWVTGRAAQLGTTGAVVVRDGVPAIRPVRRSTFYRNTEGWLLVR